MERIAILPIILSTFIMAMEEKTSSSIPPYIMITACLRHPRLKEVFSKNLVYNNGPINFECIEERTIYNDQNDAGSYAEIAQIPINEERRSHTLNVEIVKAHNGTSSCTLDIKYALTRVSSPYRVACHTVAKYEGGSVRREFRGWQTHVEKIQPSTIIAVPLQVANTTALTSGEYTLQLSAFGITEFFNHI